MSATAPNSSRQHDPIMFLDRQFESAVKKFDRGKLTEMLDKIAQEILPQLSGDHTSKYYQYVNDLSKRIAIIINSKNIISDSDRKEVRNIIMKLKGLKLPNLIRHENMIDEANKKRAELEAITAIRETDDFDKLSEQIYQVQVCEFNSLNSQDKNIIHPLVKTLRLKIFNCQNLNVTCAELLKDNDKLVHQQVVDIKNNTVHLLVNIRILAEQKMKREQIKTLGTSLAMPHELLTTISDYQLDSDLLLAECKAINWELASLLSVRKRINKLLYNFYHAIKEESDNAIKLNKMFEFKTQIHHILTPIILKYPTNPYLMKAKNILAMVDEYVNNTIRTINKDPISIEDLKFLGDFLGKELGAIWTSKDENEIRDSVYFNTAAASYKILHNPPANR